jgi:hypothetical protein
MILVSGALQKFIAGLMMVMALGKHFWMVGVLVDDQRSSSLKTDPDAFAPIVQMAKKATQCVRAVA